MELRRILLRIMLVCLALAALAGVTAVVTSSSGDALWRVIATAITTAFAVAIMLPFSFAIDKESKRLGGFAGLIWTLLAFFITLVLIWVHGHGEAFAVTLFAWNICILPAALLFFLIPMPHFRIAAPVGICVGILTFGLLVIPQWLHIDNQFTEKNAETAAALGTAGFLALLCLVNAGQKDRYFLRWLGVVAAIVLFWVAFAELWNDLNDDKNTFHRIIAAATALAALIGIDNNARLVTLPGMQMLVRAGTLAASTICVIALNILTAYDPDDSDLLARIAAGSGIVAACGILSLGVLALLNRRTQNKLAGGSLAPLLDIALFCPRCATKQKLKLNGDACASCQLKIDIRIEEPRCPTCGYLLYLLTSPNCPECGTPILQPPTPPTATPQPA